MFTYLHVNKWILSIIGIASCLITPSEFVSKPDMISAVDSLLCKNEFVVMMSLYFDPTPTREIILYSRDEMKHKDISSFLVEGRGHESFHFNQKRNTVMNGIYITTYSQGNVKASRKQVAPFLLSYFLIE